MKNSNRIEFNLFIGGATYSQNKDSISPTKQNQGSSAQYGLIKQTNKKKNTD